MPATISTTRTYKQFRRRGELFLWKTAETEADKGSMLRMKNVTFGLKPEKEKDPDTKGVRKTVHFQGFIKGSLVEVGSDTVATIAGLADDEITAQLEFREYNGTAWVPKGFRLKDSFVNIADNFEFPADGQKDAEIPIEIMVDVDMPDVAACFVTPA